MEVLSRESEEDLHIGSVKFLSGKGNKRPGAAPRIPSFGVGVGKDIRVGKNVGDNSIVDHLAESSDESEDDLVEALDGLQSVSIAGDAGHGPRVLQSSSTLYDHLRSDHHGQIPTEDSDWEAGNPLIATQKESSEDSTYTTTATVIRHPSPTTTGPPGLPPPAMSSVMTIKASPPRVSGAAPTTPRTPPPTRPPPSPPVTPDVLQHHKHMSSEGSNPSIMSYHTAVSSSLLSGPSIAAATEGSTMSTQSSGAIHRFTLHKLGKKQSVTGIDSLLEGSPSNGIRSWSPFEFFFGNALGTGGKCDLCGKRLGWKPSLECDDCGLRCELPCLRQPC
jgi:LIM domain kinase 1